MYDLNEKQYEENLKTEEAPKEDASQKEETQQTKKNEKSNFMTISGRRVIILGAIGSLIIWSESSFESGLMTFIPCLILALFMFAFGRIIDLLEDIKNK